MAHFCAFETKNGTALVNYSYLVDGTKLSALQDSGESLVYRGPFVYRKSAGLGNSSLTLESAAFGGGRLTPSGAMLYVTDYLGSVRAVVDGQSGELYKASDYSAFGEENAVIVPQHSIIPSAPLATATLPDGTTIRDSYTGKEDQSHDFGTGYIDFGARQYNPSLRRWMTPDPLSEKYYGISPYTFCNNNPVNLVDHDGRYFDKANGRRADRYERWLERKANQLDKQAMRNEKRGKDVGDLRERSSELRKSVKDIRDMRNDDNNEYRYVESNTPLSDYGGKNEACDDIIILYASESYFDSVVHESRHGGQHARGKLNIITKEDYGVAHEIDAYRAQYSWTGHIECLFLDPSDLRYLVYIKANVPYYHKIYNISEINYNFIAHIWEGKGYLYQPILR